MDEIKVTDRRRFTLENLPIDKNLIPKMTHPLSVHWHQPSTKEILIDDTHALMSKGTFQSLAEYSGSRPTGAYEGKMWKRNDGA